MFCIVNGEIIEASKATIGIRDLAVLRGYGIFDFFRLSNGVPLFMDDHLDRFYNASSKVRLHIELSKPALKQQLFSLFEKNKMPVSGVRLILTGGYTANGFDLAEPNLIITQEPVSFPSEEQYAKGVKLITHEYLRELPHIKTINYMTGIWLRDKIKAANAYDVLYHNKGHVLELTRSNIYIVLENEEIVTPKENMLLGITRKNLIEKAKGQFDIAQRPITVEELFSAKEVFLTGTTKKVLPITQIDDHTIGKGLPGSITQEVMALFKQCEAEFVEAKSVIKN